MGGGKEAVSFPASRGIVEAVAMMLQRTATTTTSVTKYFIGVTLFAHNESGKVAYGNCEVLMTVLASAW
jgi:hypothetical protein